MSGDDRHDGGTHARFGEVDSKLTIYALANGMDLAKSDNARELEWYRDGRDRGILVSVSEAGLLTVAATAIVDRRQPGTGLIEYVERDMTPSELSASFSAVLDRAIEVANAL